MNAVAGVTARIVYEPSSREECVDRLRAAHAQRLAIAPMGGATETDLGAPPARLDAIVSSRGLARVLDYAPSDQVVEVEAGVTLAALAGVLAEQRQRLACDPPEPARATIGGILATNAFGPLRARFGSLRDLIVGVSIARADGRVARGGGKVVKNVAGFDLPKLMIGAPGTLGMILTATFRLHPLPEAQSTTCARGLSANDVRALAVRARDAQLEPSAVVALGAPGRFDLFVRFEGFAAGVRHQRDRFAALARALSHAEGELSDADARAHRRDHDAHRTRGNTRLKLSFVPSALAAVDAGVLPLLAAALDAPRVVLYPTLGLAFVTGDAVDHAALASAISRARAALAASHGALVVHACPLAARPALDPAGGVWGPPPPAFALMERLKTRFDPDHRLNPGRFVGGL